MDALRQYLKRSGETGHAFALRISRAPSTISRILNDQRLPSVELALDVEKGTGGEVTAKQFMETMIAKKRKRRQAA